MTNNINQSPYIRTSRQFPTDIGNLVVELNTMYNDLSVATNLRTIGICPTTRSAITGEGWYLNSSSRQQGIRQVYTLTGPISTTTTTIPHFITPNSYTNIVRIWGTFQNASGVYCTLPYVDVTAAANQINLQVNATNIVITRGSGAPTINNLVVVLEYISNV
jgi:hypothetical protein